ncbi:MAG: DUF2087 domain-containing protein [Clostridia bacterium]|nr:DUF2087 domain-containing protein [Clostridia bacterium]
MRSIAVFLDDEGRVKQLPSKSERKRAVLAYLATKFSCDRDYTEKEVNAVIESWHTFGDYMLLRRELIDSRLLCRTSNGARYWREKEI